jgi:glycosyltransferase involved in cell wall biosynthesis
MKYSFVLPAYKAAFLREAIDSILAQSYADFELIIVNDQSPEDLTSIVNSYQDDRIQYYVNAQNLGGHDLVAQWNHCITYATGKYLILASDDDVYHPQYLEKMDTLVDKYPEVEVFRPRVQYINSRGDVLKQDIELEEYMSLISFSHLWIHRQLLKGIPFYIFSRQALVDLGGFVNYPSAWYSDDATVMQLGGKGIVVHNEILFSFRNSGINITSTWNTPALLVKKLLATQSFYLQFADMLRSIAPTSDEDARKLVDIQSTYPIEKLSWMMWLICSSHKKAVFTCWHILRKIKTLSFTERRIICREVFKRKFLKKSSPIYR